MNFMSAKTWARNALFAFFFTTFNTASPLVVLLRGPSGAGKSTLTHLLKKKLGPEWHFIDRDAITNQLQKVIIEQFLMTTYQTPSEAKRQMQRLSRSQMKVLRTTYELARAIALEHALNIDSQGGNVLIDGAGLKHVSESCVNILLYAPPKILNVRLEERSKRNDYTPFHKKRLLRTATQKLFLLFRLGHNGTLTPKEKYDVVINTDQTPPAMCLKIITSCIQERQQLLLSSKK